MPSVSDKQKRMMLGAAHDKSFALKVKVPQTVAKEFVAADQSKSQKQKIKKRYKDK